eukprot:742680-Amphidinium_carterae.2
MADEGRLAGSMIGAKMRSTICTVAPPKGSSDGVAPTRFSFFLLALETARNHRDSVQNHAACSLKTRVSLTARRPGKTSSERIPLQCLQGPMKLRSITNNGVSLLSNCS